MDRRAAMIAARKKLGALATISKDEAMPRLMWVMGYFDRTVGRGSTWEEALHRSRPLPPALVRSTMREIEEEK